MTNLHPSPRHADSARPSLRLAVLLFLAGLIPTCGSGCATATRVSVVTSPEGGREISVVLPKNLRARALQLELEPATGLVRFRASDVQADASSVIDSASGALGAAVDAVGAAGAAQTLHPDTPLGR